MLDAARASARTLLAAGVEPESPARSLSGWLVMQRLERTVITDPADASQARHERSYYEQIWLTPQGGLHSAVRCHAEHRAPNGAIVLDAVGVETGGPIASPEDVAGGRWDGTYGPTTSRSGAVETIVQDVPHGTREHSATRITAALDTMTPWLVELHASRARKRDPVLAFAQALEDHRESVMGVPSTRGRLRTAGAITAPAPGLIGAGRVAILAILGMFAVAAAWFMWAIASFNAAFTTLLWATPLVALAVGVTVVYFGFTRLGLMGVVVLAGVLACLVVTWVAFAVTTDLWFYDSPRLCPGIVEALPKGVELCEADHSAAANWLPPLFHFGQ